jgi:molybdate transport system substrate-binding protein
MRHALAVLLLGTALAAAPVPAGDVHVLSSVAVKSVVETLAPAFERSTKQAVTADFGIAAAIKTRIDAGDAWDVAILTPALLDELAATGRLDRSARPIVGRTGLGFMIKAGAPKPDVSTVDTFTRTVRDARAITYVSTGASGVAFVATLEKLGVADAVKARAKPVTSGEEVNVNITSGAADLAVLPVSEILPVAGAELGGTFPAAIQTYVVMAAAVNPRSPRAAAARAFVTFLTDPANTPLVRAKGMERQP